MKKLIFYTRTGVTIASEVLPLRMGRSIVYFCASTGDIFVSITDGHVSMDELFDLSSNQRQQTTVGKFFSDRNRVMRSLLRGMRSLLTALINL